MSIIDNFIETSEVLNLTVAATVVQGEPFQGYLLVSPTDDWISWSMGAEALRATLRAGAERAGEPGQAAGASWLFSSRTGEVYLNVTISTPGRWLEELTDAQAAIMLKTVSGGYCCRWDHLDIDRCDDAGDDGDEATLTS